MDVFLVPTAEKDYELYTEEVEEEEPKEEEPNAPAEAPTGFFGFFVRMKLWVTGLFGRTLTFRDGTVMRVEPQAPA